ncbi:MAG: CcoQ/FixQ family Cbb3-type cytochrome c oxidase assembly chaperone [Chlorobiota bacterium]|jgi:cbb3-type cytochrome oxidase subunit 3|nr:CcoQ/FixQ family Cbb3-type cytochrome c oxidase assembly chaperone [Chlorobiota bacterium]QQS66353.1 MAG: CcoQ/FixQ family Cbb3-type cytochrome c oxidase assembly chaperone [Chlorobiota bacterium]
MLTDNLTSIKGVSIYGIVSLLIFFTVFIGVVITIITSKKKILDEINNIPFNDNTLTEKQNNF